MQATNGRFFSQIVNVQYKKLIIRFSSTGYLFSPKTLKTASYLKC